MSGKLSNETKPGKIRGHTFYLKTAFKYQLQKRILCFPKNNNYIYQQVHYTARNSVPVSMLSEKMKIQTSKSRHKVVSSC